MKRLPDTSAGVPKQNSDAGQITTTPNRKREIGFAASMLGYGLTLFVAAVFFARSPPGLDPTLDGTERFAEEIGHGFIGLLLILAGIAASLVFGGIGAMLGSRAGKTLVLIGCAFLVLSAGFALIAN